MNNGLQINFRKIKRHFAFCIIYWYWNIIASLQYTPEEVKNFKVYSMGAEGMVKLGAMPSAAMVLTYFSQNNWVLV